MFFASKIVFISTFALQVGKVTSC